MIIVTAVYSYELELNPKSSICEIAVNMSCNFITFYRKKNVSQ